MSVFEKFAGKTVYLIMPDRFAIGGGKSSAQKLAEPAYDQWPDLVRKAWADRPETPPWGTDHFGGDLQGIIDHIDHLHDLGVDLVCLTPIFHARSNHKYDTLDHFRLDPMFGDMDTLRRLIEALRQRGMGLILDAVVNHVSIEHPWFQAAQKEDQQYRQYFFFEADGTFATWWDFPHLPELDIENEDLRDYFYRKPDSVLKHYLDMGVAGWRFDAAPDLGLPYVQEVRRELQAHAPEALLVGEMTCFASDWVAAGGFHGALNYFMRTAIVGWLQGLLEARQLENMINRYCAEFSHESACLSWTMLSSHDHPRLRNVFPQARQRWLALVLQFTLPGMPTIFYGEETGLHGGPDPDCRVAMQWNRDAWDEEELQRYRQLTVLRRNSPELRTGRLLMLGDQIEDTDFVAYLRYTDVPQEYSITLINSAAQEFSRILMLPYAHVYDGVILEDALGSGFACKVVCGSIAVRLEPQSALVLRVRVDQFDNFRFYKSRSRARSQSLS